MGDRLLLASLLAALLLAGCASGPSAPDAAALDAFVAPEALLLTEGTYEWHQAGLTGSPNALEAYSLASQAVAHPCVWDGGGAREPYFNNLRLPTGGNPYPPWSGNLSVALDWTEADWVGTHLRVAYRGPAVDEWKESGAIARGTTLDIPVVLKAVAGGNATEDGSDGADEEDEDAEPPEWSVWVCLPTDTFSPESPFAGSVTVRVAFQPDPMPAQLLEPNGSSSGRTARQ